MLAEIRQSGSDNALGVPGGVWRMAHGGDGCTARSGTWDCGGPKSTEARSLSSLEPIRLSLQIREKS